MSKNMQSKPQNKLQIEKETNNVYYMCNSKGKKIAKKRNNCIFHYCSKQMLEFLLKTFKHKTSSPVLIVVIVV